MTERVSTVGTARHAVSAGVSGELDTVVEEVAGAAAAEVGEEVAGLVLLAGGEAVAGGGGQGVAHVQRSDGEIVWVCSN